MSFGLKKMHKVCDTHNQNVLACDSRGMEWLVITPTTFYYGTESTNGPGNENLSTDLASLPSNVKPWAKRLLKNVAALQAQKEAENAKVPN